MPNTATETADDRARRRTSAYTGMLWHVATFGIINGFFWWLDIAGGSGVNWAYWITIFWGIALLFHIAWYLIDVSHSTSRYQKFLQQERRLDS